MIDETRFEVLATDVLCQWARALEPADEKGEIELEEQAGMLTVTLRTGRQYILSKHAPSRQIWLSSPVSGGLHFSYEEAANAWKLKDGRELAALLTGELAQAGIQVALEGGL